MAMQFTYTGNPTPEQAIAQGIKQFVAPHAADMGVMKEAIAEVAKAVASEIETMQEEAVDEPPRQTETVWTKMPTDYAATVNGYRLTISGPLGKPAYFLGSLHHAEGTYKVTRETLEGAQEALVDRAREWGPADADRRS